MTTYCHRIFCNNLMSFVCSVTQSKDGAVFKMCANPKQNQLFALMWHFYAELIPNTLYYIGLLSLNRIVFDLRCWWLWVPTFEGWPSNLGVRQHQVGEVQMFKHAAPQLFLQERAHQSDHAGLEDANIYQNMKPCITIYLVNDTRWESTYVTNLPFPGEG